MAEEVKLFKTPSIFPFAFDNRRVEWALKMKGIEYEAIDEDVCNEYAWLGPHQYDNPVYNKVPVLVHNGKPIISEFVIIEYIDEVWEQNRILSEDPFERSKARFLAKYNDVKLLPSMRDVFTKEGMEREEARAASLEMLKFVEEEIKGKKFFGGDKIGLADLAFGWLPPLALIDTGIKIVDEIRFPLLVAWCQQFSKLPIIKDCWPPRYNINFGNSSPWTRLSRELAEMKVQLRDSAESLMAAKISAERTEADLHG